MTSKRIAIVLIALALVVGGFSLTPLKVAHATAYNNPVIFIHGFNNLSTINCNAGTEWGDMRTFYSNQGFWNYQSLGFYNNDNHCDNYFYEDYHCDYWYNGNNGTVNEDIRHTSCNLAWFIWNNWSQYGTDIGVVAFSMGGILIRQAMADTPYVGAFPPYLLISDVATMGTPHQGLADGAAGFLSHFGNCPGNCTEVYQMQRTNPLMADLNSRSFRGGFGRDPQGYYGTDWTTQASNNDEVLADCTGNSERLGAPGNVNDAALCGLMPGATHFIEYAGAYPEYCHVCQNSYRQDNSTSWNADNSYSDNNGRTWTTVSGMVHSNYDAYLAILYLDW